jgi:hypothetical protein
LAGSPPIPWEPQAKASENVNFATNSNIKPLIVKIANVPWSFQTHTHLLTHFTQSHLVNIPQNVEANENNFKLHLLTSPNFMGSVYRSFLKPHYAFSWWWNLANHK